MTKTQMSSSTTDRATAYAEAVIAGDIIAGPHVRNACRRHMDDLEHGAERGLKFDEALAARALGFFEQRLRLSEGQFEGRAFKAQPAQDFIIGSLFGWQKLSEVHGWVRRFRRAYIEQGKGNGKSPLAGGIGLYGLTADREAGAQIYSAGATKDQAAILFRDAVGMVNQSPKLDAILTPSGGPGREYNLAYLKTGSFFRPVSREAKKTGSGPRPHMALCDEVHEHPDRGVMEMLERGFKFRRQPLLLMITNSGSDRNSVCWEEHEHAVKVAAGSIDAKDDDAHYLGNVLDDSSFSYVCALDKEDDPLEQPECWVKANPLLGITITEEYLRGVVEQAKAMPGKLNNILRLHFCTWTDAETAWMTRATLEPCIADFDPLEEHKGKPAYLGADLSMVKDITALAYCVEGEPVEAGQHAGKPTYDVWVEAWTPGDTLAARQLVDKLPYREWVAAGYIQAPPGQSIDYAFVAKSLADANHNYDIQCLAYDRFAFARMLEPEMTEIGLTLNCVEHPQGGKKKGKATEGMKDAAKAADREPEGLWMPMSVRQLEELILQKRIRIQNNPVTISALMSVVAKYDPFGNFWLDKTRATNKIDAAVAVCMSVGAAMAHETGAPSVDDWLASLAA